MTSLALVRRRSRREWLAAAIVLCGLTAFVLLVYVVVVLGGGVLIGQTSSPDVTLSVLATATVALAFEQVQSRLEKLASQAVHGGRASPYDVLSRFSETVSGSYPAEELPVRMARVLAEGTGAAWSQVWLVVGDRPTLAATWPPDATREPTPEEPSEGEGDVPGRRMLAVRHSGELLGVLVVQEHEQVGLTSVEERLFAGLATQAGPVLRGARLRAELERRHAELTTRVEELRASRQRMVDVQDAERRLLERDIHDGAQQHLVALAVNLRLAQTLSQRSPERADKLLAGQAQAAATAVDTLVQLSRGIYPSLLADLGLAAALRAAVDTSSVPVEITSYDVGRYSSTVEAAAYFCCLEAVQNAAKHSGATAIRIELRGEPGRLSFAVEDDGVGLDSKPAVGTGLSNMRDRIESADGSLTLGPGTAGGTRVQAWLPTGLPTGREA